jgi:hypothetical protein
MGAVRYDRQVMAAQSQRVIVDPAVQEAEEVFRRVMARLRSTSMRRVIASAARAAMRYDRQVIGYHACERAVADRLLGGDAFRPSQNEWDWLGAGVYFWEFGHQRAYDWAQ